jgi:pilus assembly protein CpaF
MADVGLPHDAVRDQVGRAVDLVVHQTRRSDGSRVVESIAEVAVADGSVGVRVLEDAA